jgi:hypothetical protein
MVLRKFLVVYTTALIIAAIVAFLRYLYPTEGPSDGGAAQVACCPWGEKQPTQTAILRVPWAMQNEATDLVVIVSDLRAPIDSLRIIGNQLLEKPDSWATIRLPLADHLAIHPISQVYGVVPIQPEERSGFLRSKRPLVWSWEFGRLGRAGSACFLLGMLGLSQSGSGLHSPLKWSTSASRCFRV